MPSTDPRQHAEFHPKLRLYLYLNTIILFIASVIGIVALPIWLFVGWWWAGRYYRSMECILGPRSLVVKKGIQFRTEKTIPLDQIQDVSVRHGPLLNGLGLTKLSIETAGQGSSQGAAASLTGVVDALAFRDRVLEQRDRLHGAATPPTTAEAGGAPTGARDEAATLLREIRDSLVRIEDALRTRNRAG